MSGGKKKKNNVNGSRQTTMNSLKRMALSPRKSLCFMFARRSGACWPAGDICSHAAGEKRNSERGLSHFVAWSSGPFVFACVPSRKLHKHVFQRRTHLMNLGMSDAYLAQPFLDLGALHAFIHQ